MSGNPKFAQAETGICIDRGKATGGTQTVLQDETKSWDVSLLVGMILLIRSRSGSGNFRRISANTATTITVANAFNGSIDNETEYAIYCTQAILFTNTGAALSTLGNTDASGESGYGSNTGINVFAAPHTKVFNGATWDPFRHATTVTSVSAVAAGTTTIIAAGGAAKKTRVYAMALSCAAGSTASRAVITDGTIMCAVEAGTAATPLVTSNLSVVCGPDGVPQPTANAIISITVTGTGALGAATVVSGLAE